jgi:hypothetical protein
MKQHVQDVKRLVTSEKSSDSFATYFTNLVPPKNKKKAINSFVEFKVKLLWKGDPLACVKLLVQKDVSFVRKNAWQ